MSEGRPTISSARVATGDIAHHTFTVVRRGYDSDEVRSYLQSVARSVEILEQHEEELREAMGEAEERAANPVIDEATLTASLGHHSAQILRHAHEEAARIVVQAQEGASTLLRDAQSQVDEIQARGEASSAERVAETELMVATAEGEARVEAERIRADAVAEGDAVIARAKDEGRALLEQVQAARKRVLADMSTKRRALSIQIEQLRAARDEIAASVHGVRDSVDAMITDLQHSDADARAAASAAADEARLHMVDAPLEDALAAVVPTGAATAEGGAAAASAGIPDTGEVPAQETAVGEAAGGAPGDAEHGPGGDAPSVDELFARIRAGTDEGEPEATTAPEAEAEAATAPEAEATTAPEAEAEAEAATAEENPDQALIVRRDELLSPVTAQLSRHIKRALGDDQNRLLDVLRSAPSTQVDALLGPEDSHMAVFTAAALGHLSDAFGAGAKFAGGKGAAAAAKAGAEQSAAALSRAVVTMLRRRIEDGTDAGEDVSARVGAAFREWRGERIDRLVGDCALQSFSAGVLAASPKKGTVRWVLTSTEGCSDCDDNALAGAVPVTEGFPTGHAGPPAHSGCRCLVTPLPA